MKESDLKTIFDFANYLSNNSPNSETKVCALLFVGNSLKKWAVNDFVKGGKNLPNKRPEKYEFILHAEEKLILSLINKKINIKNAIIFCTLSPCPKCLRIIWEVGIRKVFFEKFHQSFKKELQDIKINLTNMNDYSYLTMEKKK